MSQANKPDAGKVFASLLKYPWRTWRVGGMPCVGHEPMAGWVKDAHKVKFTTIYYSLHPHHGEDVIIIRSFGENIIIQTQDGKRIGVPKWMTDKTECLRINPSPIPGCSHNALKELQRLLACIDEENL